MLLWRMRQGRRQSTRTMLHAKQLMMHATIWDEEVQPTRENNTVSETKRRQQDRKGTKQEKEVKGFRRNNSFRPCTEVGASHMGRPSSDWISLTLCAHRYFQLALHGWVNPLACISVLLRRSRGGGVVEALTGVGRVDVWAAAAVAGVVFFWPLEGTAANTPHHRRRRGQAGGRKHLVEGRRRATRRHFEAPHGSPCRPSPSRWRSPARGRQRRARRETPSRSRGPVWRAFRRGWRLLLPR